MARITLKQALEQIEALRHNLSLIETERDSLRAERVTLSAELNALHHDYDSIHEERKSLLEDLGMAKLALEECKAAAPKPGLVRRGATPEQQAAHDRYLAALAAARDLAKRTGRSVVVG